MEEENFQSARPLIEPEEPCQDESDINRSDMMNTDMKTLCILKELNQIYELRLAEIDEKACGDYNLKYLTCMEWVNMLKRLMSDLLDTINELEFEAVQRISLLERKLHSECNTSHRCEASKLRNDLNNLLEFIRRAMNERKWNLDGLRFYTITETEILGKTTDKCLMPNVNQIESELIRKNHMIKKLQCEQHLLKTEINKKDIEIENYTQKIRQLENLWLKSSKNKPLQSEFGGDNSTNSCINEMEKVLQETEHKLAEQLQHNECLESELRLMKSQNTKRDQTFVNMKALAIEVAEKHDQLQQMRSQIFSLEEDLKAAHKKIQFKDNVIKELRKECKSATKCFCVSRSANTSPRKFEDKSLIEDLEALQVLKEAVDSTSFLCDESDDFNRTRTPSLNTTAFEDEFSRIRAGQEIEAHHMKILQRELKDFFKILPKCVQTTDYQKQILLSHQSKLDDFTKQAFLDFCKVQEKLSYVRKQLRALIGLTNFGESDVDSGYLSQEEMEPELSIINSVSGNLENLKTENCSLKNHISNLRMDIQNYSSALNEKCAMLETKDKILKDIADFISNARQKNITIGCTIPRNKNSELLNFSNAALTLECLFAEREQNIFRLQATIDDLKKDLQCLRAKKTVLEHEIEAKNQTIFDLQETIADFKSTIQMIEAGRNDAEMESAQTSEQDINTRHKEILEAKMKLEVECQLQQTTIQNLRQALESLKRGGNSSTTFSHNSSSVSGSATGNRSSLWNWWHSNVHDV